MGRSLVFTLVLTASVAACLEKQVEKVRGEEIAQSQSEPSHVTEEKGEVGITLDSAMVVRIDLKTEILKSASRSEETDLPAILIADPEAITFIRAGVAGRLGAIEGVDWPHFGSRLVAGDSLGVIGDARPVRVPRSGTVSRVLVQPGELVQPGQELFELTTYDGSLVQVAWPASRAEPPGTMEFSAGDHGTRVRGTLIGPAPEADPLTRDPAWLYRVSAGWKGMRPGASATAHVPDGQGTRRGVLVPAAAMVQWDALTWVYQERGAGRYVRVRVPSDHPIPGGWLVSAPLAAGDRVVVNGAGQLLSEEFRARIVVGEEVGE